MVIEGLCLSDALSRSTVIMSTVGYGDITPKTEAGRLFAVLLIVMGGAGFLGGIANMHCWRGSGSFVLRHLREHYPYLFSLAIRTNPCHSDASAVIGG